METRHHLETSRHSSFTDRGSANLSTMSDRGIELPKVSKLSAEYKRSKADEAFNGIVAIGESRLIEREEPRACLAARQWVYEQTYGKTPERMSVTFENAPWVATLRKAARAVDGQPISAIDTTATVANGHSPKSDPGEGDELYIEWGAAS